MKKENNNLQLYLNTIRKALHEIPEIGNSEYKTSLWIQEELKRLAIDFEIVHETGIIAKKPGKSPKGTIAFRADMDALPILEQSDFSNPSLHPGYMHACGHDGHMSMLLGLAYELKRSNVNVIDDIVLIFQPAEEGPGGAKRIVEDGYLKKHGVNEIYGIHVLPDIEEGHLGICRGPAMAMVGEIDLVVNGTGSHGAKPHQGVDAIVIASEVVLGIQTIVSRNIDPLEPVVITLGTINGGERRNIIAGAVSIEGTVRAFDEGVFDQMMTRLQVYLNGIAMAYNTQIDIEIRKLYPPVINDIKLYDEFYDLFSEQCQVIAPQMISEDFSYYQQEVPGFFYFLGTRNESLGYNYPLHHPKFNFNNEVMVKGTLSYVTLLKSKGAIE